MASSLKRQLYTRLQGRLALVRDDLQRSEESSLTDAEGFAYGMSSGGYDQATLTSWGHPYAVRHSTEGTKPLVTIADTAEINVQTGTFRGKWQKRLPEWSGWVLRSRLFNDTWYAKFFAGTRNMVPRPIVNAIASALRPVRLRRLAAALKRGRG